MGGAGTHTDSQSTRNNSHTHNHKHTAEILPSNGEEKDVENSKWVIQIGFADNQKIVFFLVSFRGFRAGNRDFPIFTGSRHGKFWNRGLYESNWYVHTTLDAICRSSSADKKRRDQQKWTTTKTNAPDDGPCKNWDWPLPFPSTVLKN
jgi:hypothetical protein